MANIVRPSEEGSGVSQLEFERRLVERLEQIYATRDVLRRRELVRAALGARAGDRVLDVGCGPGFYVSELVEVVGRDGLVAGVDVSADMLAVAAKRAQGHGNVESGSPRLAQRSCTRPSSTRRSRMSRG
jgi:SAM-dependent methyltransferase